MRVTYLLLCLPILLPADHPDPSTLSAGHPAADSPATRGGSAHADRPSPGRGRGAGRARRRGEDPAPHGEWWARGTLERRRPRWATSSENPVVGIVGMGLENRILPRRAPARYIAIAYDSLLVQHTQ